MKKASSTTNRVSSAKVMILAAMLLCLMVAMAPAGAEDASILEIWSSHDQEDRRLNPKDKGKGTGKGSTKGPTASPTSRPTLAPTVSRRPTSAPTSAPTKAPFSGKGKATTKKAPSGKKGKGSTKAPTPTPTASPIVLTVQEDAGECLGVPGFSGVGCGLNPNDLVICFNAVQFGVSVPLELQAVRFWLAAASSVLGLPVDLKVRVWNGSVSGGPTGNVPLYEQTLARGSYVDGENTVTLSPSSFVVQEAEFCVGLSSDSAEGAGLAVLKSPGTDATSSFFRAPECTLPSFSSLKDLPSAVVGGLCIQAIVIPKMQ